MSLALPGHGSTTRSGAGIARNRFVRAAIETVARLVSQPMLAAARLAAAADRHQVHSPLLSGLGGEHALRAGHIFQLDADLRSLEGQGDACSDTAAGLLPHPAIEAEIDASVAIQGHPPRFATVDLTLPRCFALRPLGQPMNGR